METKTYKVITKVENFGKRIEEIQAESLLDAQTKTLANWGIDIKKLLEKSEFTQTISEEYEYFKYLAMTWLGHWSIAIVED